MRHHYNPRNPELTKKALDFIVHYGRETFDKMINKLLDEKKSPIKEGWIIHHKETKKLFKGRKNEYF